ncbi:hypothetical protein CGCVW01_v011186 [Colletotrichum viniferum]|nr:hypothetical protein CGCVW01_v011186 [Colletotrichum viniferum]
MAGNQKSLLLATGASTSNVLPTTTSYGVNDALEPPTNQPNATSSPIEEPGCPSVQPLRPLTPSTDIIKRIGQLFCEDSWTNERYTFEFSDFIQIIKESTTSRRQQRDFNRYTDKLLRGKYQEVAGHIRSDRSHLRNRLHRAEDAALVSKIGDAISKKDRFLFMVHKSIWSDSMDRPDWRLYPSKEAVEMSVFQEYWEDRPRRRDDSYDSDDYPDDNPPRGLGPFSW